MSAVTRAGGRSATISGHSFFVMIRRIAAPEKIDAYLDSHLAFMVDLEKKGDLVAAGPLSGDDGDITGGLVIVRADSMAAAEAMLEGDPFISAGIMSYELAKWRPLEGQVTVMLDLSDRQGKLV